mgnify:CR=1 FL=1
MERIKIKIKSIKGILIESFLAVILSTTLILDFMMAIFVKKYNYNDIEELLKNQINIAINFYEKYFPSDEVRQAFVKRTDDLVWEWTDQGKLKLKAGVKEALEYFNDLGLTVGIASNNYKSVVDHNLWVTGCRNSFDFIVTHDEVAEKKLRSKPFPDLYLAAQERSGLGKDQLLIFEDSSMGVEAAENAGIDCVMIPDIKPASAEDRARAQLICPDFFDFLKKIS